jgi:hypothetical protein
MSFPRIGSFRNRQLRSGLSYPLGWPTESHEQSRYVQDAGPGSRIYAAALSKTYRPEW